MSGSIPSSISALSSLSVFEVQSRGAEGDLVGKLPLEVTTLSQLVYVTVPLPSRSLLAFALWCISPRSISGRIVDAVPWASWMALLRTRRAQSV